MRSTVSRVAFRGASRYLRPGTSRGAAVASRTSVRSRDLCTVSAVSTDAARKPEDTDVPTPDKISAVNSGTTSEPAVEIISEDPTISAVEPAATEEMTEGLSEDASSLKAERASEEGASQTASAKTDPAALKQLLDELLEKKATRSALWYYAGAMKVKDCPAVDAQIMKMMLPLLGRNGWAPSSMDTINLAIEREYNLGVGMYNCGLHAMSRSGDPQRFGELLSGMWKLPKESQPNAASYTYLIGAHVYRGGIDEAFEVLNEMKKHLIYPTFATYHALITGCLRRRDSQRAFSTLLAVEKHRFDVSAMTIAQVLVSSAQNDNFDNVLVLLAKLEEALPRYATEVHRIAESRNTYKLHNNERTSKDERAELRGHPRPELGAISEVLHSAFRGGRPDIAMAGWTLLHVHYPDLEIPKSMWYCMIGAFAGAGDFSRAFDVLGSMREAGLEPSLKDLEMALIRPLSFDVAKIDEQFFKLVDRFEGKSAASDAETVATEETKDETSKMVEDEAATSSEESKSEESLADVLSVPDMPATRLTSDDAFAPKTVGIDELNCVIAACSFANDLDRAFQTYDEIEARFGLERNADSFNALLEGCVQVRHVRGGLRILQEMENVGLSVTGPSVQLAVRLLLRGGRANDAVEVVRKAQSEGAVVPLQTYQMLVRHCMRGGLVPQAVSVAELASATGIEHRILTGRLGFDALQNLNEAMGLTEASVEQRKDADTAAEVEMPAGDHVAEEEVGEGAGAESREDKELGKQ